MKIRIKIDDLDYLLGAVAHGAADYNSQVMDVQPETMIHLEAREGRVTARTTHAGVDLETTVECETVTHGEDCIRADKLEGLAKNSDSNTLEIKSEEAPDWMRVTDRETESRVPGCTPALFPERPDLEAEAGQMVEAGPLRDALKSASMAIARKGNEKAHLKHGFVEVGAGELRVLGTDSTQLVRCVVECEGTGDELLILPREAVAPLVGMLPKEGLARIAAQDDRLIVTVEELDGETSRTTTYSAVLANNSAPDFDYVIERGGGDAAVVDIERLQDLLELGRIFAGKEHHHVQLNLTPGVLELYGRRVGVGEGRMAIPVVYDGKEASIWANCRHLRQIADDLPGDEVRLELPDGPNGDPIRLTVPGRKDQWITMPMKKGPDGYRQV